MLDRVAKLLALASSPNVHEAALAASRAAALIDTWRLEGLVGAADARAPDDVVLEAARRPRPWRAVLASGLAEREGCLVYSAERAGVTELHLVGRPDDIAAVTALFGWLAPRIEWLSATHGAGRSKSWHQAFRVGAIEAILDRSSRRDVEPAGSADPAALLRIDRDTRRAAVDAWARDNLRLGQGRGLRVDARAYERGKHASGEIAAGASRRIDTRPEAP